MTDTYSLIALTIQHMLDKYSYQISSYVLGYHESDGWIVRAQCCRMVVSRLRLPGHGAVVDVA